MVEAPTIRLVNNVLSLVILAGLLYLLDFEVRRLDYSWQPVVVIGSAILLVLESGLRVFMPADTHVVHLVAALLLVLALYDPVRNRIRVEEWADLLLGHPAVGFSNDQYTMGERQVLELLADSKLVLSPDLIAENIEKEGQMVENFLETLATRHLIETVNGTKYRITPLGRRHLQTD